MAPKISVVLPVYNAEDYIGASVESILCQTYSDFELIIIDDGSIDGTKDKLNSYNDSRILLVVKENNTGLVDSLNLGIKMAKGEYIARMDADDICEPERFLEQVAFLDSNTNIGVVGTSIKIFGNKNLEKYFPVSNKDCQAELLFRSCFAHPSVMLRKELFVKNQITYSNEYFPAEDYYLWIQFSGITEFYNIDKVLLRYRLNEGSISVRQKTEQILLKNQLQLLALEKIAGITLDENEASNYIYLLNPFQKTRINWVDYKKVFLKIEHLENDYLKEKILNMIRANVKILAFYNTENGISMLSGFYKTFKSQNIILTKKEWFKYYIKSIFAIRTNEN